MSQTVHRLCGAPRLINTQEETIMTQAVTNREVRTIEVTSREEINKAIFHVITHNIPKKEMKEECRLIKKQGYEVYKGGRHNWVVRNPVTNKYVSAEKSWREVTLYNNGRFAYKVNIEGCNYIREYFDRCHVDFVGILEKPVNKDWFWVLDNQRIGRDWWYRTPTQNKFTRLKSAKSDIGYKAREIKEIQKKIEELQKDLIRAVAEKVRRENRLNEVRKELGLRERS